MSHSSRSQQRSMSFRESLSTTEQANAELTTTGIAEHIEEYDERQDFDEDSLPSEESKEQSESDTIGQESPYQTAKAEVSTYDPTSHQEDLSSELPSSSPDTSSRSDGEVAERREVDNEVQRKDEPKAATSDTTALELEGNSERSVAVQPADRLSSIPSLDTARIEQPTNAFLSKTSPRDPSKRASMTIGGRTASASSDLHPVRQSLPNSFRSDSTLDSVGRTSVSRSGNPQKPLPPPPASPSKSETNLPKPLPKPLPATPSSSASPSAQVSVSLAEISASDKHLQSGPLKSFSTTRKVWTRHHAVLSASSLYIFDSDDVRQLLDLTPAPYGALNDSVLECRANK